MISTNYMYSIVLLLCHSLTRLSVVFLMVITVLTVKRYTFESGERYALIINAETGIPLMHQNLYVTIHIRNKGDSINTMIACLGDLRLFDEICEYLNINFERKRSF